MIGLDTNVLARYYIADKADAEAAEQHEAARRLIESQIGIQRVPSSGHHSGDAADETLRPRSPNPTQ